MFLPAQQVFLESTEKDHYIKTNGVFVWEKKKRCDFLLNQEPKGMYGIWASKLGNGISFWEMRLLYLI